MPTRRNLIGVAVGAPLAALASMKAEGAASQADHNTPTAEGLDWSPSPDCFDSQENRVCFSKGLRHNRDGCTENDLHSGFLEAIRSRNLNALESLNFFTPLVDPTAGRQRCRLDTIGNVGQPWFNNTRMLGDLAELYWASLCRDIPFSNYGDAALISEAERELELIDRDRFVHPLFGRGLVRTGNGGIVSQFLLKGVRISRDEAPQQFLCPVPARDFLTSFEEWTSCQDGAPPREATSYLPSPRFISNGRALAEFVRSDYSYQAFLSAALIIQSWGRNALNPGLASRYTRNTAAFVENGWPQILALVAQASQWALEDAWYWKWRVFRRLRPEELSGRVFLADDGVFKSGVCGDIASLEGVKRTIQNTGTPLLAQAYPEGAPLHPSFPAGHAQIAGACVTILKAFTDPNFLVPAPVLPSDDGTELKSHDVKLSIEGELNKLAWNIAFGRSFAGIHYRSDNDAGLLFGEEIALQLLADAARKKDRDARSKVWLRRFNGRWVSAEV